MKKSNENIKTNLNLNATKLSEELSFEELLSKLGKDSHLSISNFKSKLMKEFLENALNVELDLHLGYKKWDQESRKRSNNYRNGYGIKTVRGKSTKFKIIQPRDKEATFSPQIIKKRETNVSKLEERILFIYAKNNYLSDISKLILSLYEDKLTTKALEKITTAVASKVFAWLQHPLENSYPFLYFDKINFRFQEENLQFEREVFVAIGIENLAPSKALGLYLANKVDKKFWDDVFLDLKTRGLSKPLVIISDAFKGFSKSVRENYYSVPYKRGIILQIRNAIAQFPLFNE